MTELSLCRWRERRADGTLVCHSDKFIAPPNRVDPEFCRSCRYCDHESDGFRPGHFWDDGRGGSVFRDREFVRRAVDRAEQVPGLVNRQELLTLADLVAAHRPRLAVEIGSWKGRTSVLFAALGVRVLAVDDFSGRWSVAHGIREDSGTPDQLRQSFDSCTREFRDRGLIQALAYDSCLQRKDLTAAIVAAAGSRRGVDLFFIDGNHEYPHVSGDIALARDLVKPGGLICGHDAQLDSVRQALNSQLPGWSPGTWKDDNWVWWKQLELEMVVSFSLYLPTYSNDPRYGWRQVSYRIAQGLSAQGVDVRVAQGRPQLLVGPAHDMGAYGPDRSTVGFTMWECDRLRSTDADLLNRLGAVVLPSQWGIDCYQASGVTAPLFKAPLGHDPSVFRPKRDFPEICTFGSAALLVGGGFRKNLSVVVEAFRQAFPRETDVRLRLKVCPEGSWPSPNDPRIDVIDASLSEEQLSDWYGSLTAFVSASSAEGFGLHLLEAMACGRPVVTVPYSGVTEYFDADVGYPVDYSLVDATGFYTGRWARPDVVSLSDRLRAIYTDSARAQALGRAAAVRASRFTWAEMARRLFAILLDRGFLAPATAATAVESE